MFEFFRSHWPWIAAVGLPLLATLLATVANRFADPDNNPATPAPKWVRAVLFLVDVLSWVGRDGKLTFPGKPTPAPETALKLVPPRSDAGFIRVATMFSIVAIQGAMLLIVFAAFWFGGCATAKTVGYATLTAAVNGAAKAQAQLAPKCEEFQNAAVDSAPTEGAGASEVTLIQKRCDAALAGLGAADKTARTARDGMYDAPAGNPSDALAWGVTALDLYKNLAPLLASLGVQLPKLPGGL